MGNAAPHAQSNPQAKDEDVDDLERKPLLSTESRPSKVDIDDERLLVPTPDGYFPHLDIWRFMCICIVVLDHGNPHYSETNIFFGQNWALQYIFVICGVAFGLSKRSLSGYLSRLALYLIVGVACNWAAFAMAGLDWRRDPWNVVFQFWFVVALLAYSLLLMPLKRYLDWCVERPLVQESRGTDKAKMTLSSFIKGSSVVLFGLAVIWVLISYALAALVDGKLTDALNKAIERAGSGLAYWAGEESKNGGLLVGCCAAFELTASNIWLVLIVPAVFPHHQSCTGWLVLFNMHLRRLALWYSGAGEKLMNGFDLMLLGLVCYELGVMYRRPIGAWCSRYWFVWLSVAGLIWKPGTVGRLDLLMPEEFALRWRMQILDTCYSVVWLCAGERFIDPAIFTEDRCDYINALGLFLFLVHKAIHVLLPCPWNWFVIIATGPVFYLRHKMMMQSK